MRSRHHRFTVYDMMEAKGVFASNPANADSIDEVEHTSLYRGPVEYPKMLYHPTGETRVIRKGEVLLDRDGQPRLNRKGEEVVLGELREIIWQKVAGPEEEEKLRLLGWHEHPALAIAAGGGEAPAMSSNQRIRELEAQLERAKKELEMAQKISAAGPAGGAPLVKKKEGAETSGVLS